MLARHAREDAEYAAKRAAKEAYLARELEVDPDFVELVASELKSSIAQAINEVESTVSPDMLLAGEDNEDPDDHNFGEAAW